MVKIFVRSNNISRNLCLGTKQIPVKCSLNFKMLWNFAKILHYVGHLAHWTVQCSLNILFWVELLTVEGWKYCEHVEKWVVNSYLRGLTLYDCQFQYLNWIFNHRNIFQPHEYFSITGILVVLQEYHHHHHHHYHHYHHHHHDRTCQMMGSLGNPCRPVSWTINWILFDFQWNHLLNHSEQTMTNANDQLICLWATRIHFLLTFSSSSQSWKSMQDIPTQCCNNTKSSTSQRIEFESFTSFAYVGKSWTSNDWWLLLLIIAADLWLITMNRFLIADHPSLISQSHWQSYWWCWWGRWWWGWQS